LQEDLLRCYQCGKQESKWLLYYKKRYYNKVGFFDPMLLCEKCALPFKSFNPFLERHPVLTHFKALAKMKIPKIMWLCSDKDKECNQLAYPVWRSRLIHIKKYTEGVGHSTLYWMPMPL